MTLDLNQRAYHAAILRVLADSIGGGYLTRHIAKKIPAFGHNGHTQSGATLSWLNELEREGFVKRLDNDKPIVWAITETGRAALNRFT